MAACILGGLGLVLAIAPSCITLGCELVIGDEDRVAQDAGDAALPGEAGSSATDADSGADSCAAAQTCVDTATMCAMACVQQDGACAGKGPATGCPTDLPACKMMCLVECVSCTPCPTASSACASATR
jgi:hypothetical protein